MLTKIFYQCKKFFYGVFTILYSIWKTGLNFFNDRETIMYPDVPLHLSSRYRGRIVLTRNTNGDERCVGCGLCSVACPVGCISLKKAEDKYGRWYAKFFRINFSRCIFCGMCEEACPTMAIQLTPDVEMSDFKREDLIYEKDDLLISGSGKYPEYDFYSMTGVIFSRKLKDQDKYEVIPIDVRGLLP